MDRLPFDGMILPFVGLVITTIGAVISGAITEYIPVAEFVSVLFVPCVDFCTKLLFPIATLVGDVIFTTFVTLLPGESNSVVSEEGDCINPVGKVGVIEKLAGAQLVASLF